MNIRYCSDFDEMSQMASKSIVAELDEKRDSWLGVATGNSPKKVYALLVDAYHKTPKLFQKVGVVKLDEWGGIPMDAPNSCETFIQERILKPLEIPPKRYIAFKSNPDDPQLECERIQKNIDAIGTLEVCILGLGKNGHLAFNEPAENLKPQCHVAELSQASQAHEMVDSLLNKPTYGLTVGMADILNAKKIILLITGEGKENVVKALLIQNSNPLLPASFLWQHNNVECFVDLKTVLIAEGDRT
ncbi:MAG: galactosamine-6-phosphate isomerase [Flavobacteriaceae bacterium]